MNNKVRDFRKITEEMADLYELKNSNYGDSFSQLYNILGPVSVLVPLHNKLTRATNLVKGGKNNFESLEDTLVDLANYAIMGLMEIRNSNEQRKDTYEQLELDLDVEYSKEH